MKRRLWLSSALAVGIGLLVAAGFAGGAASSSARRTAGGTFTFSKSIGVTYVDPALAYYSDEWMFEYATCAKLMNYPDEKGRAGSQLEPEIATGFPKISRNGRQYTFTLRKGWKYNTGKTITAADFKQAFLRGANQTMKSPAISYEHEIVGADAYNKGEAPGILGITASGNKLTVGLTRAVPDFVSRLTMPFFCPVPPSTPFDPNGINNPPGSGPYYIAQYTPDRLIDIRRNPHYKGKRPHKADRFVYKLTNASLEACRQQTIQGAVDWCVDGIPPSSYAQIAKDYGINRKDGQYFESGQLGLHYLAMNTTRPIFKSNVKLRKAINYAINRPLLAAQGGFHSGKPTDQILPPSMPGYKNVNAYPLKYNAAAVTKARALAKGNTRDGHIVLYNGNSGARRLRSQVIKANLENIPGITVDIMLFAHPPGPDDLVLRPKEPWDLTDQVWTADYPDPSTLFGDFLRGTATHNISHLNVPKYNRAIDRASRLSGPARYAAFGKLDVQMMTANDAVPWAPYATFAQRDFVSSHVGCYVYHPVFGMDLAQLCRK